MNLQILLQKEKNMVQGIKEIRTARFAEYKEKKKEKQKEYFKKSLEDLKKIILKINKIYEKKLVGANVPKDIYETIKILKMQTFIDDKDKIKFEKLVKQYNSLVSKLEKLQVSL
jgi:glutaredoxin 2